MNYNEFIKKIFENKRFGKTPNLLVVEEILKKLGNPHKKLKFIHIAGTNGKGSVSNYISCALCDAGFKTGLFTSPYIEKFNERFRINNKNISDDKLAEIGTKIFEIANEIPYEVKQFDIITAIGIYYFYLEKCDYVVLEAGMGGRNDSTNVIIPVLSVIATISYDHTMILGATLDKIAYEKAGIIKDNIPVCCYPFSNGDVEKIIREECEKRGSEIKVPKDIRITKVTENGSQFIYDNEQYKISMAGKHQVYNASLAILALKTLGVKYEHILNGIKEMKLTGRFEKICENPSVYVDGGHNPEGAKSIVDTIEYHNIKNPVFIISMVKEKDMENYLKEIDKKGEILLTSFDENICHNPLDFKEYKTMEFNKVIDFVKSRKYENNYVFCGSLYQISKIKEVFDKTR